MTGFVRGDTSPSAPALRGAMLSAVRFVRVLGLGILFAVFGLAVSRPETDGEVAWVFGVYFLIGLVLGAIHQRRLKRG